jgi:hypothetical protein
MYAFLKDLALSGKVVFPLSASHYRENWARENLDGQWDTAVVMAELSGFNSITTEGLTTWETKHAVSSFLGLTSTPASPPTPFGWGASHCVSPLLGPIRFILDQTREEPTLTKYTPDQQSAILAVQDEIRYRTELFMLALTDSYLEVNADLRAVASVPDPKGKEFLQKQMEFRALLEKYGRSPENIRNWTEASAFLNVAPLVMEACSRLGTSFEFYLQLVGQGDKHEVRRFLRGMSIFHLFIELRIAAHSKRDFKFKESDLVDFLSMATVIPFADFVVATNALTSLWRKTTSRPLIAFGC